MRAQSCPTLCDPMDCSPPGSYVHGFSRSEYWSGSPFPPPGDLPDPGIEPMSSMSPALGAGFFITEPPGHLAPETKPRSGAECTFKIHPAYLNMKAS